MPATFSNAVALEPAVVVFDARIFYPFHLRNVVVQTAVDRLVDAHWTDEIHDEWIRNLAANVPIISLERLQITRSLMDQALPNALISSYSGHIGAVTLPDPNDRHVVAVGIACGAWFALRWQARR